MVRRAATAAMTAAILGGLGGCADTGAKPVAALSRRCADTRFPIYFQPGSDQLTQPGRDVIALQARRMAPCKVSAVDVVGLADADAPVGDSLELSQRRAAQVAQALAAAGLPAPAFDIQALGSAGAVTPSGRKAPLHRRAEVVLHASPA